MKGPALGLWNEALSLMQECAISEMVLCCCAHNAGEGIKKVQFTYCIDVQLMVMESFCSRPVSYFTLGGNAVVKASVYFTIRDAGAGCIFGIAEIAIGVPGNKRLNLLRGRHLFSASEKTRGWMLFRGVFSFSNLIPSSGQGWMERASSRLVAETVNWTMTKWIRRTPCRCTFSFRRMR